MHNNAHMSAFENDQSPETPSPESLEYPAHTILKYPALEIDLSQPSHVDQRAIEAMTSVEGSKLVATISTPFHEHWVVGMDIADYGPLVMIINRGDVRIRRTIGVGEDLDLSDEGSEGKCIMTVDIDGRVFVNAEDVDTDYRIFTRTLDQYVDQAPPFEDSYDDPES
jgi:hypothetical protein